MKTSSLVSSLLLASSTVLADTFKVKTDVEGTDYFFSVGENENLKLIADDGDLFQLTADSFLEPVDHIGFAVSHKVLSAVLQSYPNPDLEDGNTHQAWTLTGEELTYPEALFICGAGAPFELTTDGLTYPGNGEGDLCSPLGTLYTTVPAENTVDPTQPMRVSGKLGGEDVSLKTDGLVITLEGDDLALFTIDNGYLKVGEKFVFDDSGVMRLVDTEGEATPDWALENDKLVLDGAVVEFSACDDGEGGYIVNIGSSSCDSIEDIVVENYVEPPVNTVDPTEPMKVSGKLDGTDVSLKTDGVVITLEGDDLALFTIDNGYLKVGEKFVFDDSGVMRLVDTEGEATPDWALENDKLVLDGAVVEFSACDDGEGGYIVNIGSSSCDSIEDIVVENYVEPPVNTVDPEKAFTVTVLGEGADEVLTTDGTFVTIGGEDPALFTIVGGLLKVGDKWVKLGDGGLFDDLPEFGKMTLVDDEGDATTGWSLIGDQLAIDGQVVPLYSCTDNNGSRVVYVSQDACTLLANLLLENADEPPEPSDEPIEPSDEPTPESSDEPTPEPSEEPTPEPSEEPTPQPSEEPSDEPTPEPSEEPSDEPTPEPSEEPTPEPSEEPSDEPTPEPSEEPTPQPSEEPSDEPTPEPSEEPTGEPSDSTDTGTGTVAPGSDSTTTSSSTQHDDPDVTTTTTEHTTITEVTTVPGVITTTECDSDSSCSVVTRTIQPVYTTVTETECDELSSCSTVTRTVEVIFTTVTEDIVVTITDCEEETICVTRETVCTTVYTTYCPVSVTTTEVATCLTDLTLTITVCDTDTVCEEHVTVVKDTEITTTLTTYYVVNSYVSGVEQVVTVPGQPVAPGVPGVPAVETGAENAGSSMKSGVISALVGALLCLFPLMM
ncbi:hypothetical protein Cantr_00846 [Candida viswanathii]|uniref:Uncharacterized protein n=1 Tax=Candida viswanathii TaxID=5486 RepID=A0A367YG24_9ASCO|nr:hypothetical protein Cantr_00846 [Candida viswanathii]